jgi:tetratricopeptide (TPR) repeat protein
MGTLMSVVHGAFTRGATVAGCLFLALGLSLAQNTPRKTSADSPASTRALLADKAKALEARGRPDLSIQLWQQILLSEPNNVEALAGLAKDLKLTGSDKAIDALDRLRKASPNNPEIAKIQALASTRAENAELRRAGDLAKQGKADEAMAIYKQLYGGHPPDGDIALSYYQTLYGTANGKQEAINGMRALSERNPGDPRFAVELGTMLTYEARTRADGIRILREHPKDSNAQAALRQALVWDAQNPSSAGELREYLKEHPQDTELSGHLKEDETKLAQMNAGIARTPAERAAFAALNAKHLDEAEKRFTAILDQEPNNGRVAAGMGFLRMQQNNFGDAIGYLEKAEANGFKDHTVVEALSTSHFWFTMGQASQALNENRFDEASAKYREALEMRPRSPEALNGLAGLLTKQQQYAGAALIYDQLVKIQPGSTDGWRGLFLAYARDNQNDKAMAVEARFPAAVKVALAKDPEYLRTLATIYQAMNRIADAQRVLAEAMALPFPDNGTTLKADTKAEYAALLMQAKRYDQAIALYTQMLNDDPGNVSAWIGMVSAMHEMGQDTEAIADVQKMPPAVYESALADSGFLSMLGAIYQQANQFEVAQGLLERSVKLQIAAGAQPSIALQLQLAGIYLLENDTQKAYGIYHQVLATNPDRADAWKGLIAALTSTHRDNEALQQIAQIPATVRKQLDADIEFVQSEASIYAATGDLANAIQCMNRVQAHYAKLRAPMPPAVEIQNAWLLFNTNNDRALYPALMRLGSRADLTATQRETVQDIWANWSVRRAAAAMDNGNLERSVDILDAASQAFPDNLAVRKAVAGGYVQVGRAKESLALYKTIPMQDAAAGDFQGAIGAALSANDKTQAEQWLRQALERFPRDPAILALAARYEQARGDNQRAADYYRASLAAMPSTSPAEKLAHVLVNPDQDTHVRRAVTAADLKRLLDPENEPFAKITRIPPLPAYGPDPYNGSAPVVLAPAPPSSHIFPDPSTPSQPSSSQPSSSQPNQSQPQAEPPQIFPPPASKGPSSPPPVYVPQSWARPRRHGADLPPGGRTENSPGSSSLQRTEPWERRQYGNPSPRRADASPAAVAHDFRYASPHHGQPQLICTTLPVNTRNRIYPHAAAYFRPASLAIRLTALPHAAVAQSQLPPTTARPTQLSASPPHSEASDAWKGLVFSLMASSRNAEALDEIAKIPADVRQQLESDVEFVQAEAGLYAAVGDIPHATEYLNRVEAYYQFRRADVPAGLEVQHAYLLYNLNDDHALYPVLQRLDARADLTAAQREQVQTLWANFAVRRAEYFLNNGNQLRGVQLLQAAAENYPNNMGVRRAVAGAYAKTGRAADALALFKTIPLDNASPSDYQGAIGAALAATDMAQAESWLRQALARYPGDPQILGMAARFEQARGNTARAADFWRASLAAMPPGSSAARLDGGLSPQGGYAPPAGDMKRLLDPRNDPGAKTSTIPALPAYGPNNSVSHTPLGQSASPSFTPPAPTSRTPTLQRPNPQTQASRSQWTHPPSSNPLPLPGEPNPAPDTYGTVSAGTSIGPPAAPSASVPQKFTRNPNPQTAGSNSPNSSSVHTGNKIKTPGLPPSLAPYAGKMNLPPSEETVDSTSSASDNATPPQQRLPPAWTPGTPTGAPNPAPSLRITSRPMGPVAAQAQALFADQTDGQLTQGSASAIHNLANAPVNATNSPVGPLPSLNAPAISKYDTAQYTPNAQEAATGAYSAPKQQAQPQQPTLPSSVPPSAQQTPSPSCVTKTVCPPAKPSPRHTARKKPKSQTQPTPTLSQAPAEPPNQPDQPLQQPLQQAPTEVPAPTAAPGTDTGLSDEELQQRNLPPLRGPWIRIQRQPNPISPRDEAEMQLHSIEAGYSPWLGGSGLINYRSGSLGYDHLAALEAPFEASMPLGFNTRLTIVAKPVFLDSGQADGTSTITVQESTTAGTQLVSIPQPIGTLTATATTLPAQQNAVGIGGEVQLAFPHLAIAGGYTPEGFLVATITGRAYWKPANGPFTFNFSRDPVRDTQLSYSGLRDPSGDTLGNLGQIWGGVVANQGQVQFARGDAESGFYIGGGGQYLAGYQVETNTRVDGSGGAYWRLKTMPEYGNLSIGANFFGMHYAHNEDAFTHGMGGYFSPQAYFLANVPFTWVGHYATRWHYNILGSLGVQAFQENLTPLWPLAVDKALETALSNAMLPAKTSVGPNYDLRTNVAYQIGSHWFAGGFLGANNSRNYTSVNAGFSIHYMFRVQPSTATTPTGIFPTDGVRPFTVP